MILEWVRARDPRLHHDLCIELDLDPGGVVAVADLSTVLRWIERVDPHLFAELRAEVPDVDPPERYVRCDPPPGAPAPGSGGEAFIEWVYDRRLLRKVIRKVPQDVATDAVRRDALLRGRIRHPNVLPVFDLDESRSRGLVQPGALEGTFAVRLGQLRCVCALDLVQCLRAAVRALLDLAPGRARGQDLPDRARMALCAIRAIPRARPRGRELKERARSAARALRDVALALHAAHEAKIAHGDVKPSNVLFGDGGVVYLTDFGCAVSLDPAEAASELSRAPGRQSPEWRPPDSAAWEPRSLDRWGLGRMIRAVARGGSPDADGVPWPELDSVGVRSQDRLHGYNTSTEIADELDRWLEGEDVEAYSYGFVRGALRRVGRHPTLSVAVGVGLLVATGGGGAAVAGASARLQATASDAQREDVSLTGVATSVARLLDASPDLTGLSIVADPDSHEPRIDLVAEYSWTGDMPSCISAAWIDADDILCSGGTHGLTVIRRDGPRWKGIVTRSPEPGVRVTNVAYSPVHGVAAALADGSVWAGPWPDGLTKVAEHGGGEGLRAWSVAWTPQGDVVSGGDDSTLQLSPKQGSPHAPVARRVGNTAFHLTMSNDCLYVTGSDYQTRCVDPVTLADLPNHIWEGGSWAVAPLADRAIAVRNRADAPSVWLDAARGDSSAAAPLVNGVPDSSVAALPTGVGGTRTATALFGNQHGVLRWFDPFDYRTIAQIDAHETDIKSIEVGPTGLVATTADGNLRIWRLGGMVDDRAADPTATPNVACLGGPPYTVLDSAGGLHVGRSTTGTVDFTPVGVPERLRTGDCAPDGVIYVQGWSNQVWRLDGASWSPAFPMPVNAPTPFALAAGRDSIVLASLDGKVLLVDRASGVERRVFQFPEHGTANRAVTAGRERDGIWAICDVAGDVAEFPADGTAPPRFTYVSSGCWALDWLSDGRVVVGDETGGIESVDLDAGSVGERTIVDSRRQALPAIAAQGDRVAAGSERGDVFLLDVSNSARGRRGSPRLLARWSGRSDRIQVVSFDDAGGLWTTSMAMFTRRWDLAAVEPPRWRDAWSVLHPPGWNVRWLDGTVTRSGPIDEEGPVR